MLPGCSAAGMSFSAIPTLPPPSGRVKKRRRARPRVRGTRRGAGGAARSRGPAPLWAGGCAHVQRPKTLGRPVGRKTGTCALAPSGRILRSVGKGGRPAPFPGSRAKPGRSQVRSNPNERVRDGSRSSERAVVARGREGDGGDAGSGRAEGPPQLRLPHGVAVGPIRVSSFLPLLFTPLAGPDFSIPIVLDTVSTDVSDSRRRRGTRPPGPQVTAPRRTATWAGRLPAPRPEAESRPYLVHLNREEFL